MKRFVIARPQHCIGCNTCLAACSETHKAVGLLGEPRLWITRTDKHTAPMLCRQCDDAPCARVCPVNAITRGEDAIVLNESLCIGCKLCGLVCPFGAITCAGSLPLAQSVPFAQTAPIEQLSELPISPDTQHPFLAWQAGVRSVAVKCDLCSFHPEGPACVRLCPTQALQLIESPHQERLQRQQRAAYWQPEQRAIAKLFADKEPT